MAFSGPPKNALALRPIAGDARSDARRRFASCALVEETALLRTELCRKLGDDGVSDRRRIEAGVEPARTSPRRAIRHERDLAMLYAFVTLTRSMIH